MMRIHTIATAAMLALTPSWVGCASDGEQTGTSDTATAETNDSAITETHETVTAETAPGDGVETDALVGDSAPAEADAADNPEPDVSWQHTDPITTAAPASVSPPYFVEVTEAVLNDVTMRSSRAMVVDLDGDGVDDLVTLPTTVAEGQAFNPAFAINEGPGGDGQVTFRDATADSGMADAEAVIMAFGDVDNDGDEDCFTGSSFRAPNAAVGVWLNDGAGHFTYAGKSGIANPVIQGSIYKEMAAISLADFDGDGLIDLYLGFWYGGDTAGNQYLPPPDELYKGDGGGAWAQFPLPSQTNPLTVQVAPDFVGVGRAAYGMSVADADNDGDLDMFINNYGAGRPAAGSPPRYWDHNLLWRNDGDMSFADVGAEAGVAATERGIGGIEDETPVVMNGQTLPGPIGGNGFGCQFGDLDNDGDLDLVVGTIAHPDYPQSDRTMLHYNQLADPGAALSFTEESNARGLEYYEDELHPALVDIDNDGRLDFAMSRLRRGSKWEMYFQRPDGTFAKATWADSGVDIERPAPSVWLDFDGDGDLDFFMPKGTGRLFENTVGQANHWLELRLVANAPRDASGARVTIETSAGTQMREIVGPNGHYNTQLTRGAYFGLGGDSGAADVTIRWPDGEVQTLGDVKADHALRVVQGGDITVLRAPE